MLSLDNLQKTIARSVLGRAPFGLSPLIQAGRFDPYGRLRVYQNNTRASLTSTLMGVFPVTTQLVDERYFRYAASEFVRLNPPREPRLVRYGTEFPPFLRTFERLQEMPFVSEVARLEWAIAEALDAPSRPARTLADLDVDVEGTTPELVLQPSLRLLVSHWPVLSIWAAHQQGHNPSEIDPSQREAERIALWRQGDSVRFAKLSSTEFAFRHALQTGRDLDKAVTRAAVHDPMFDALEGIVSLFADELVEHVRFPKIARH